jgi:hypothetical protein
MRSRAFLFVLVCLSFACKRDRGPISVSDQSKIPVQPEIEPPVTIEVCYAGIAHYGTSEADLAAAPNCAPEAEGCLDPQPVAVRRTSTPEYSHIIEEWVDGATESTYPTTSVLAMTITDARFALIVNSQINPLGVESERQQLSWTGEGELIGEPWHWTTWTSKQARRPPVTDVVTTRIEGNTLHRETAFTLQNGSVVLLRHDELHEFACSEWDARRKATLTAAPPI